MSMFNHFCGVMDMKTGVIIITVFALLNKISGIYGILSLIDNDGGVGQISMYIYSIVTAVIFAYFLSGVVNEHPTKLRVYSHIYSLDILINTFFLVCFSASWYTMPRETRGLTSTSDAPLINATQPPIPDDVVTSHITPRAEADLWHQETPFAAILIVSTVVVKVYFALCVFSYYRYLYRRNAIAIHSTVTQDAAHLLKKAAWQVRSSISIKRPASQRQSN